jgi:predicted aspartyl protease
MRGCALLLYMLLSRLLCLSSVCDDPSLKGLYDSRQLFELREAINKGNSSLFYQGIVACSFNDIRRCAKNLETVIDSGTPSSEQVRQSRMTLAAVYFRSGQYQEALSQVDAILGANPNDPVKGQRALVAALARLPDQSVTQSKASKVPLHTWGEDLAIPLTINGRSATYAFDTGNFAVSVSLSEAKRIGLRIYDTGPNAKVNGLSIEVGLAEHFDVGGFRFRNVAFIVFPDDQEPFRDMPAAERGLIGLPTLLAFRNFSWGSDGTFEFGLPSSKSAAEPNISFDEQYMLARVGFGNSKLTFGLDTGGETTTLALHFAQTFAEIVKQSGKKGSKSEAEIGSSRQIDSIVLPELELRIDGHPTTLRPAHILLDGPATGCRYGDIGMDLLKQSHKTTIDFQSMTLTMH